MDSTSDGDTEIYRFPEFFERLEARGVLRTRDAVESETEIDGIVYHHRGVQLPARSATFVWTPESREIPTFRLEIDGVGPRAMWVDFDARLEWDVYLRLFDGGAAVAWMSDPEFEEDEAADFASKAAAIHAGRFSFGSAFLFGPDWVERENWALESTAPALLQLGNGQIIQPETPEAFYEVQPAIPPELRPSVDPELPDAHGVVDAEFRGADDASD